ncbi:MAG: NAD-glutamate dehydrogenase [Rickettsiales bacterium]|nr:NAD-glutamate dehydrogenase [Rickettsiales bacterium]
MGKPKMRVFAPDYAAQFGKRRRVVLEILNDDMPFLVDSTMAALARKGFDVYVSIHPILQVQRDRKGHLLGLSDGDQAVSGVNSSSESLMHFHISALPSGMPEEKLLSELDFVLQHVFAAVGDWHPLLEKVEKIRAEVVAIKSNAANREEVAEAIDFLDWLGQKNFIFLGYAEYDFYESRGQQLLKEREEARLGVLRVQKRDTSPQGLSALPAEAQYLAMQPNLIELTKANTRSLVHRPVYMDYVDVKRFNAKGKVIGEVRFLGLFTSLAYYQSAENIPFIRRKIARIQARAGYDPVSHNGKALRAILEFYPREELFQISEDELFETSLGILSLEARPDIGLFVRKDAFERSVSCLVYLPRDKFNTFVRKEVAHALATAFDGKVLSFYTQVTESSLARVHYIIKTTPGQIPEVDFSSLRAQLGHIINYWVDALRDTLIDVHGDAKAEQLYREFGSAFSKDYINAYPTTSALFDIEKVHNILLSGRPAFHLYIEDDAPENFFRLKIYTVQDNQPLSMLLPLLENMGMQVVDVHPFTLTPSLKKGEKTKVLIRDFIVSMPHVTHAMLEHIRALVEEALLRVWTGEMENDGFNVLVARAQLSWRQVVLLRAYGKYLKQAGLPYSTPYMATALGNHPRLAALLFAYFEARFGPTARKKRLAAIPALQEMVLSALSSVTNLAEDRIIRRYQAVIDATLRTNFFQTIDGLPKSYVSFKLNSREVPELPLPRPHAEIFVYSIRSEGIHLRGGKVARGGLRWSDRAEDFRTEVLGLMKAQMVKNAVIVPVGSKGGFIVKQPPLEGGREALLQEGIACYKQFLSGLLDITDNIVGGAIVPPQDVVRYDEDDPYLVVAADKGTASFSDYANSVSKAYGFWLGDAFASGGSAGYDHKLMAITARGAWISVQRHFREMGMDIQSQPFTCVGIGDMSGDVFGNGMLLSKSTQLVAAFNHQHIFFDPTPDTKLSFKERKRLFDKPRSSWADYKPELISKGGGIYERKAKSISLSREVRTVLGTDLTSATPDELIRLILKAPVDLLWNGGIGTYVKAETESHDDVGDRSNDAVRINGSELRAKVVGEGGNLGFTQRGRIEYALLNGRLNTDAIDNSAGVDTSDHEVNIKIALSAAESTNRLTRSARDTFLATMTDDVAELVLRDNRLQTQALTIARAQGFDLLDPQVRLMQRLERKGLLDRTVEFLPNDKQIAAMRVEKRGFTRPELAVMLSYAKIALYNDLIASDVPDLAYFERELLRYFPEAMLKTYATEIRSHRLRREIIATVITNSLINRTGIAFLHALAEDTGRETPDITRAYVVARDAFGLRDTWMAIEALDGKVDYLAQVEMFAEVNRFLERVLPWLLNNLPSPLNIEEVMGQYGKLIQEFECQVEDAATSDIRAEIAQRSEPLIARDVPVTLARRIATLEIMACAPDVVSVALNAKTSVRVVGDIYFQLGEKLDLDWLRSAARASNAESHWDRLAIKALVASLYDAQRRGTQAVLAEKKKNESVDQAMTRWWEANSKGIQRYERLMRDIKATDTRNLATLVVSLQSILAI